MTGETFWLAAPYRQPAADPPGRCDVAIAGAGFTGLSAALALADAGVSVCVFERGAIGEGASSRNAGLCTVSAPVPAAALVRRGEDTARVWLAWFARAVDATEALAARLQGGCAGDIGFRRTGAFRLAQTAAQARALAAEVEMLDRLGACRQYVDAAALPAPLQGHFTGARYDSQSAVLHPGHLHLTLANAARAAGVTIVERCPVLAAADKAGRLEVRHARGVTRANKLLFATNGYSRHAIRPFRDFVVPVESFAIVTEAFSEDQDLGWLAGGAGCSTCFRFPHYFRILPGRRLLFGGRPAFLGGRRDACASWLYHEARRMFSRLTIPSVTHGWGGKLGFTADKRPLLGRLDARRYYAMGCAGHGVPTSVAFGQSAAAHILGKSAMPAPFWREPADAPTQLTGYLRHLLPAVQLGMKLRDAADRTEHAAASSFMPAPLSATR